MSPFDYLNAINTTKEDLMLDPENEKAYSAYMVNRGLSYFPDTVKIANEMNVNCHLDGKMQFHFLINIVRKRKRFSKWLKPEKVNEIEAVKEYYGYSNEKARQAMTLLSPEQIKTIKNKVTKGGRRK